MYYLYRQSRFTKDHGWTNGTHYIAIEGKLSEIKKQVKIYAKRSKVAGDNFDLLPNSEFTAKEIKSQAHFAKRVLLVTTMKDGEIFATHEYMVKYRRNKFKSTHKD